ncbi:hypothetical protein DH2020_034995 [Rehmannia glutinosa]|uniref:SWIRM domain-containing protein n=1 Tax=Rehmannia glutinosa TaxID=99300 RepID=A0ABR0VBE3_REHGL
MDEEKKMGLKRKSKQMETSVDSDDDEPIGALLKLKGRRNSKKSKLLADGGGNKVNRVEKVAVEDEEFGAGKKLSSNVVEPSCPSLNESVKDSELDPNGISEVQKRCLESTEGGSSGNATTMEGLKVKAKMKNKRSKVKSGAKVVGTSELDDDFKQNISGNDAMQHEKNEGPLDSEGEALEDSLSAFFQKVQSGMTGKARNASRLKQVKQTQVLDDGSKPNSGAGSEAPVGKSESASTLAKKFLVPDDNRHAAPGQDSNQIWRSTDCMDGSSREVISENSASVKITGVEDDKINSDAIGDLPGITNICDDVKLDSKLDTVIYSTYSAQVQLHSSPFALDRPQMEHPSGDLDGPVRILDKCSEETDHAPFSSKEADNQVIECKSSPVSASESLKYEVVLRKHKDESHKVVNESEHVLEPSRVSREGAGPPNCDYPSSEIEEVDGTSYSSIMLDQGSCAEDRGSLADPETKESSLSIGQRAVRNAKKHRHGDMAYEGDIDWEVLMQAPEFFVSHQTVDKTRDKLNSSSTGVHAENGKAAAVAAGLKARAAGPLEKIKFKEVLKRKGGLQEYLECRNHVLSVWNKDVSRILPLADVGVSEAPLVGESPRASLIRDIFTFLDQCGKEKRDPGGCALVAEELAPVERDWITWNEMHAWERKVPSPFMLLSICVGYINFGVPSEKNKVENCIKHDLKVLTDEKFGDNSGLPVSEDGDSLIVGKDKSSETCVRGKDDDAFAEGNLEGKVTTEHGLINLEALESSAPRVPEEGSLMIVKESILLILYLLEKLFVQSIWVQFLPAKMKMAKQFQLYSQIYLLPGEAVCGIHTNPPKGRPGILSDSMDCASSHTQYDSGPRKNIIVVGAGPAGLTAARHLQRQGFIVTVLEARSRIGGRVFTDRSSLSVPVDLGASIITGVEADVATERRPDPSSLVCAQLGLELTVLNSDCPLYDTVTGQKVPADLDEALEAEYNSLLDEMELLVAEKGERAMKMSLEEGLEYGLKRRRMAHSGRDDVETIPVKSQDTSVAAETFSMDDEISNAQGSKKRDDVYGGFGGAHCMIKGGYSAVVESLGEGICIHLDHVVTDISYRTKDCEASDKLHKNVKVSISNGKEFSGDAVLITVPLGCLKAETIKFSPPLPQWKYLSIKRLGFGVLNKVVLEFPEVFWDDTIDYFGATAEDRDQRGRCFMFWNVKKTVGAPVLIALVVGKAAIDDGQNICSSDNVSHALLVLRKLFGEDKVSDPVAAVVTDWGRDPYSYGAYSYVAVGSSGEDYDILGRPVENCLFFAGEATCKEHPDTVGGAMMSGLREAAARRHSDIERSEVKDIIRRLDAIEFSGVLYKKSLDGSQISSWGSMLKDMFFTAKTTAGRLHLAKELLNIPDSMGKDGTQLLRHCVRLLVLVSNDLLAVRLSGIGKTVKEKVCVHTSRDIRAIASQLVSVWVELFRKEKASKGGRKLLRQSTTLDSKSKSPQVFGKPPLRNVESKGNSKVSASAGHQFHSGASTKNVVDETRTHLKAEVNLSNSNGSTGCGNAMDEDNREIPMSEEEKAAFAAAEAARAAAIAAAKALAASGARHNASLQPPKILSFHKFAMRGQHAHMDESDSRKNWSGAAIGRQDCFSEIDSRNCRVRDWTVDFSATGVNPESSKMLVDNRSQRSHSNEIANQLNFREHSGESVAVDSSILTKAWVDSAGSIGIKDYSAIERWQCQAAAASSGFSHGTMHITDEEESNTSSKGADRIKRSVVDYVASLLMPLYNAKKIDREGYKSIMKKTATKVMEQATDGEKAMAVFEFLDYKRKNKIRAFVDMLVERHMAMKPDAKSGSSEKD